MSLDYKNLLNGEQYEAVTKGDGACLVLAGAGSGKTRTLVFRVAYLLEQGVLPDNILLVTFTNKAANEMISRVESLSGIDSKNLWGGTFHRIANKILRKHADKLGYNRSFNILDGEDSVSLIKASMQDLNIATNGKTFPKPNIVQAIISYARNTNQDVSEIAESNYGYPDFVAKQIAEISFLYETKKHNSSVMDFDDLLVNWLKLLIQFPELKEYYSNKFKYILVDEYQDTNYIQSEIVKLLASKHKNILVVGDDSQSIYSFRAANVKNILEFPKIFADTKIYKIEKNYRSTPQILKLANNIIKNNLDQYQKNLMPVRADNTLPVVTGARDANQQAVLVAKRIIELYRQGVNYNSMAILYRSNFHSAEIQLELSRQGIPYIVRGGMRYFEQAHIKDVIAYIKVLSNFKDELAWKRILNLYDGVGSKTADNIWQKINKLNDISDLFDNQIELAGKASNGWTKVLSLLKIIYDFSQEKQRGFLGKIVNQILYSGYDIYLQNNYDNYKDRVEDVTQMIDFVSKYDDLEKFLTDATLSEDFSNQSVNNQSVVLSTIHQAKGLEWPCVFIIGLRDGNFPHHKSVDDAKQLEEERRLFYVAVTRAKDELNLYYPIRSFSYKFGEEYSKPSMFIEELDQSLFMTRKPFQADRKIDDFDAGEEFIYYD